MTNQTIDLPEDGLEPGGYDPLRDVPRKFFSGWADEPVVEDVVEEWHGEKLRLELAEGSGEEEEMDEDVDLSS